MNPKIKISQLPAKGANLGGDDLIEVAEFTGTGYVSKSITGDELIAAIPPAAAAWGAITGTLSSQTDLQSALNAKQDTLTLTTTGTSGAATLVGATLNIPQYSGGGSSSITIGTTAITSGTVGRILFEGTGNVVQESGNLFWDDTNKRLNLISITGANNNRLNFRNSELGTRLNGIHWTDSNDAGSYGYISLSGGSGEFRMFASGSYFPTFYSNGSERMRIPTTGNVLINTTTDAGFRLDVNGSARVSAKLSVGTPTQATAIMEVTSTTQGFLPPRMTTTQKNAITTPAAGLQVFDTTLNMMSYYNGTIWISI